MAGAQGVGHPGFGRVGAHGIGGPRFDLADVRGIGHLLIGACDDEEALGRWAPLSVQKLLVSYDALEFAPAFRLRRPKRGTPYRCS